MRGGIGSCRALIARTARRPVRALACALLLPLALGACVTTSNEPAPAPAPRIAPADAVRYSALEDGGSTFPASTPPR